MDVKKWCEVNRVSLRQCLANLPPIIPGKQLLDRVPKPLYKVVKGWLSKNCGNPYLCDRYKFFSYFFGDLPSFVFIIPSYNNSRWVVKNLLSVFNQRYLNYRVVYIDDCSSDGTYDLVNKLVSKSGMWGRFTLLKQPIRSYQACSRFLGYHECDDDEVLCMLDGDDWLASPDSLFNLVDAYRGGAMVTYGSYYRYEGGRISNMLLGNEIFPEEVLVSGGFRNYRWTSCHLRTGYAGLFKRIKIEDLLDPSGGFLRCCTDLCEMYPVLEMATPNIRMIPRALLIYNKDASMGYSNSYFNKDRDPLERKYREGVLGKLGRGRRYGRVDMAKLLMGRYREVEVEDYEVGEEIDNIPELVRLLDMCGLGLVARDLDIDRSLVFYDDSIRLGRLTRALSHKKYIRRRGYVERLGDLVLWVV